MEILTYFTSKTSPTRKSTYMKTNLFHSSVPHKKQLLQNLKKWKTKILWEVFRKSSDFQNRNEIENRKKMKDLHIKLNFGRIVGIQIVQAPKSNHYKLVEWTYIVKKFTTKNYKPFKNYQSLSRSISKQPNLMENWIFCEKV